MKPILLRAMGALVVLFCGMSSAYAVENYSSSVAVFEKSPVCQPYFKKAYGYAMFPTIGQGAFGIGAAHGDGQVYRDGKVIGYTAMTQISIGFQLGGQAYSQIIFFEDKRAYDDFTRGNFEFDASASAVAITAGAQASAGTTGSTAGASAGPATGKQATTSYYKGMSIFVHTKGGLMYEAAVGGQKFSFKPVGN
ncbi:MAG: lipid-binding SYLF domain-containing protein [Gammaproteobacteria bacterium]|nr:lipid-binding SYLF domain-containing protein [Gammaproteobacteria bacterium]MDX2459363.1 lipid-binding SYLF domain-containing protein [Gammaproteobacteria bacterium]